MKLFSCLSVSLLLAVAIPATCALASVQFNEDNQGDGGNNNGGDGGQNNQGDGGQNNQGDGWHNNGGDGGDTNDTPMVRIISPEEGAAFLVGDAIQICADVDHFTNPVASVEFFAGTNSLGLLTNSVWDSDVYCLTVTNLTADDYMLTALATDTGGNTVVSEVVDISVVTNFPPVVHIVAPCNGAVFLDPTNIEICAATCDPDGTVASVQFFEGTNSLGTVPAPPVELVTNRFGVFPIKQPFCLTWSNAQVGAYVLTAVAMDNVGATGTSAPVSITVVTDLPPCVHIVIPKNCSTYFAPANVTICAEASDPDGGTVASVQFFQGTNSLGVITTPLLITNWDHVESIYSLTWSNVAAGTYILTALATDNAGLTSTSCPVKITVCPPPPPKVIITCPQQHETFYNAPANISITAFECNFTNPVVNVQFFAGTNSVGATTNSPLSSIVWSNAPPGAYLLTALATDSSSLSVTSAPVCINVTTNQPSSYHHHGD